MEHMNSTSAINSGTPEEIEALFNTPLDPEEKMLDSDRGYYFSLLDSGDTEGFLPSRIRNIDKSAPDYSQRRSDVLEVRYFGFKHRFEDYIGNDKEDYDPEKRFSPIDEKSPVYADIRFLSEKTRKVFEQVYRNKPISEAFEGASELAKYKELMTKYFYENFFKALNEAKTNYPYRAISDEDVDNLLRGVSGEDAFESLKK